MPKSKKRRILKGFTLVELIVVLVVMAILASMSIGALTGYIDKAKEKEAALEAKRWFIAAQAAVSEVYADGNLVIKKAGDKIDDYRYTVKEGTLYAIQFGDQGGIDSKTLGYVQNMDPRGSLTGDDKIAALTLQYMDSLNDDKNNEFTFVEGQNAFSGTNPEDYFKKSENKYSVSITYNSKGQVTNLTYAKAGYDKYISMGNNGYKPY